MVGPNCRPGVSRAGGFPVARPARVRAAGLRAAAFLAISALLLPAAVHAQVSQSVRIESLSALSRIDDGEWSLVGLGRSRIRLLSTGHRFVRGELAVDALYGGAGPAAAANVRIDIHRAFVRTRFPLSETSYYHITAGKARLTWGVGTFYNAGDLLFGAVAPDPDLTAETVRDEADWLAGAFIPLGPFTFLEPVVLPPVFDVTGRNRVPDAADTAAGIRFQTRLAGIQMETAYLYRGASDLHQPALSLQGHLLVDAYVSVSTSIPGPRTDDRDAYESLTTSLGLYHVARLAGGETLSLRLEGLVRPAEAWRERSNSAAEENPTNPYGLMLYPEVVWSPTPTFGVYLRGLVSPIDVSAMIVPGFMWNLHDGLTFSAFAAVQAGESTDVFAYSRPGGLAVTAGLSFVY